MIRSNRVSVFSQTRRELKDKCPNHQPDVIEEEDKHPRTLPLFLLGLGSGPGNQC